MRLVYLALAWCGGIVWVVGSSEKMPFAWVSVGVIGLVALLIFARSKRTNPQAKVLYGIAWLIFMFGLGALRTALMPTAGTIFTLNNMGGMTIEGIITAPADHRDTYTNLRVEVETVTRAGTTQPANGIVLVQAPRNTPANYGDRIMATGALLHPPRFDTFSYADYLARSGVYSLMRDVSIQIITPSDSSLMRALVDIREHAANLIALAIPEPQAGLLTGILLGDERGISPALEDDFAATGVAHIIAISGFNMVVLSSAISGLLSHLRISKRNAALISLIVIAVYTLFVGASPAVTRAALMSALLVIGKVLNRKTYVPASLAFAAILLSAFNPFTLWDVGFQLSFTAVFSITLLSEPLAKGFNRLLNRFFAYDTTKRIVNLLNESLIVGIAALIGTLPITILYFGRASIVALIVNILVVPIQPLVLILGGLATLLAFISLPFALILFMPVFLLLTWTIGTVRTFADIPFASVDASLPPNLVALIFGVLLMGMILNATKPTWAQRLGVWVRARKFISLMLATLIFALAFGFIYLRSLPDGRLHVWVLDVGHNHAVLIQTPNGAQMLLDGGRYPSRLLTAMGDRLPFYDRNIEVLAVTHPDNNDISALLQVSERYDIGAMLYNGQENTGGTWLALLEKLAAISPSIVERGTTFALDQGVMVEVLHPALTPSITDNFGDGMLVLRLRYDEISFLFTSDMSIEAQTALLDAGLDLRANVLILPKHGGEGSLDAAFLAAVNPHLTLVQADITNTSGDPAPDTLALLGDIPLLRTDLNGTIHIISDGRTLEAHNER